MYIYIFILCVQEDLSIYINRLCKKKWTGHFRHTVSVSTSLLFILYFHTQQQYNRNNTQCGILPWYLYQMVAQNTSRTRDRKLGISLKIISDLRLLSIETISLNRSNDRNCTLRAHLFLSYHLKQEPWCYSLLAFNPIIR